MHVLERREVKDADLRREGTYGEVLEGTGFLDVGEGGLELLELDVDLSLGLLGFSDLRT